MAKQKTDLRKNNGGHTNGGRKKIFINGVVKMTFKFDALEAERLKNHPNANLLIRNLINNYFEKQNSLTTPSSYTEGYKTD